MFIYDLLSIQSFWMKRNSLVTFNWINSYKQLCSLSILWVTYRFGSPARNHKARISSPVKVCIKGNSFDFIVELKRLIHFQKTDIPINSGRIITRIGKLGYTPMLLNAFGQVNVNTPSYNVSTSNDTSTAMACTEYPVFIDNGATTAEISRWN